MTLTRTGETAAAQTPVSADQARATWVLTPRNTPDELARWQELYERAVPRPPVPEGDREAGQ